MENIFPTTFDSKASDSFYDEVFDALKESFSTKLQKTMLETWKTYTQLNPTNMFMIHPRYYGDLPRFLSHYTLSMRVCDLSDIDLQYFIKKQLTREFMAVFYTPNATMRDHVVSPENHKVLLTTAIIENLREIYKVQIIELLHFMTVRDISVMIFKYINFKNK